MKKLLVWLLCALLCLAPLVASASVVEPNELFYVYDGANVLSEDTEAAIVLNNDALYDACGAQIVFVTIRSAGSMQLADYAYKLFDEWGIGSAERNNGLLVLMEIGAEDYWYLQGSGLERDLPTGDLAVLVNTYLEPDFAVKEYDRGAEKLFRQLFETLTGIYGVNLAYVNYQAEDLYRQEETVVSGRGDAPPAEPKKGFLTGLFSGIGTLLGYALAIVVIVVVIKFALRLLRAIFGGGARSGARRNVIVFPSMPRMRPPRPPRPPRAGPRPGSFGGGRSTFGGSRSSSSRSTFGGGGRSS
ncbi:MAG: TPM domain-containing protein, partial [Eubacteriales bacterium]|nr:TPM domain-containing protein [Eubacteriales bacterium]